MMFAQIADRSSLRDIVSHFGTQSRRLYHLGIEAVNFSLGLSAYLHEKLIL